MERPGLRQREKAPRPHSTGPRAQPTMETPLATPIAGASQLQLWAVAEHAYKPRVPQLCF